MTTRNDAHSLTGSEVAIVGMAGRFPGAGTIEEYWHTLVNGIEGIERFGEVIEAMPARQPGGVEVRAAARLKNIDLFDAEFFGFTPKEAELTDPQHRLFLECACEALERAGHDPERFRGLIGVYAGMGANTYLHHVLGTLDGEDAALALQSLIGNDKDYLATIVSYKLNLRGPSITVQTACSTSLVAVHLACQALLDYECDMALAGGVSIRSPQPSTYRYYEGGILSPDGYCRAFDARAQGTLFGNGLGLVVVRRLEDALKDGDQVHAVIRGSAVNNDGSGKVGYTAPSVRGQVDMITGALARAGVDPGSIGYIEAHGTGTALGDPIEVTALTEAFRTRTDEVGFCGLGSVKTNIGHLDAAAGIAGLIKTVLALSHRTMPPTLHFREANPRVPLNGSPFYIVTKPTAWDGPRPRRAAVSSLGIGGTNAHMILEEAPELERQRSARSHHVFALSARSTTALDAAAGQLAAHLKTHPDLNPADVAYTLQVGRRAFSHRRVTVCERIHEAAAALAGPDPRVVSGIHDGPVPSVAFMFPGGGAHHVNMAAGIYRTEPVFRRHVDNCLDCLPAALASEVRNLLYPDAAHEAEATRRLWHTSVALPALFAVEYALAQLWMEWGVRPQAMLGHSLGEYVAACLAGVFTLPDALSLVARRSELLDRIEPGAMLSVPMSDEELRPLLGADVSVAAVNAPSLCVVSGPTASIQELSRTLSARGIEIRPIPIAVGAHSCLVEPVLETFRDFVAALPRRPPQLPFVSDVTGTWITPDEATSVEYWARHLRQTVRFSDGVGTLLDNPYSVLLEAGPGRTLSTLAKEHPNSRGRLIVSSLRHPQVPESDVRVMFATLGQLWVAGVPVDWEAHQRPARPGRVLLPTYPFERSRFWIGPDERHSNLRSDRARRPVDEWCHVAVWKHSVPVATLPRRQIESAGAWLIFCDEAGLGDVMVEHLRSLGERVIRVTAGEAFTRVSSDTFVMNPARQADYDLLFRALDRDHPPHTMVHLWNVNEAPARRSSPEMEEEDAAAPFNQMLFLVQSAQLAGTTNFHLAVCTNHLAQVLPGEVSCPTKAPLAAICRVMPQEYAGVKARWIDLALPKASFKRRRLARLMVEELQCRSPVRAIAYRGTQRWVQGFEQVILRGDTPPRVRAGGAFLITGGLGSLGLMLARHLATTVQARLVLVGRTALPPREAWDEWLSSHSELDHRSTVLRTLAEFESCGVEVHTIRADVSKRTDVERMFDETWSRFGRLDGIFHLAGVPGGGLMQWKTPEMAAAVFAPKVNGTRRILEACKRRPVDFVVLFSSIAAVTGGVGQSDYCAASLFMDAIAGAYAGTDDPSVIAVHWDAWQADRWQDAGLAQLPEIREQSRRWRSQVGIRLDEGVDVLSRVLGARLRRVIVSTHDLRAAMEAHDRALTGSPRPTAVAPQQREATRAPGVAYVAPATSTEARIVSIWQDILGVSGIGIHDTFISLGGHSLLMLQVVARLRQELETEVPVRALFEKPTVAELAAFIDSCREQPPAGNLDDHELESLLDEVERLTPEQVRSQLAELAAPSASAADRP